MKKNGFYAEISEMRKIELKAFKKNFSLNPLKKLIFIFVYL